MLDLQHLKNKLAAEVADSGFRLEQRTAADLLQHIENYTALMPFASNSKAFWSNFWLSGRTAQQLEAIYQDTSLAERQLPVQQAFLLALIQLLETPKLLLNTLPARHRLLYYRDLLGFRQRECQPDSVAVNFTLLRNTSAYLLPAGTALDAGQDQGGNPLIYLTDRDLLVTPQQLEQICWTRQAGSEWKVCKAQDNSLNIALPEGGIRLFSSTENEETLQQQSQLVALAAQTEQQDSSQADWRATGAVQQALYLGFSDVTPGETLSLYWSLKAPSALNLAWFYYNQQQAWVSLASQVQDSTGGFSLSNLWQVRLPTDAAKGSDSASFAADYYWIKAIEAEGEIIVADQAAKVSAVMAGAITATLNTATTVESSHFLQPLPANAISQLLLPVAEISQVNQPLPSTGGKLQETLTALLQRAATRIAHRQRGISWGNMRSLLMENHPQLYDVQFPDIARLNSIPALEIQQLMAIPDTRYRDNDDALRPTLSTQRLRTMTDWLKHYCSLWATPELVNPTYVDVTACYRICFASGISPEWGYSQIASWLQQCYMPWGEVQQLAVTPGNRIDYYQLLATIQQSPLVQRVTALTLSRDGKSPKQDSITASEHEVLILIPTFDPE